MRGRGAGSSKKRSETYNIYIYKVLKQVHPEMGVSKRAMYILNSFVYDIFDRICTEASKLCQYSHKQTLSAREVRCNCCCLCYIMFVNVCVFDL